MSLRDAFETDRALGYGLLRATLGVNICLHGVTRIGADINKFAQSLVAMFHATVLPPLLVSVFGYVLPWMEATVGLLVLLGFLTRYALTGGALLILMLTFGTALRQDWETAGVQLIYALVFCLLLVFRERNSLSLDRLLARLASGT